MRRWRIGKGGFTGIEIMIIGVVATIGVVISMIVPMVLLKIHLVRVLEIQYELDNAGLTLLTLLSDEDIYKGLSLYVSGFPDNPSKGFSRVGVETAIKYRLDSFVAGQCYELSYSGGTIVKGSNCNLQYTASADIVLPERGGKEEITLKVSSGAGEEGATVIPPPPITPPPYTPPTVFFDGLLHVEGTYIVDESGNRAQLRSILVSGNERMKKDGSGSSLLSQGLDATYAWWTEEDVYKIKSWGANTIDVHIIALEYIIDGNGNIKEEFFTDFMDYWVDWVTSRKMYCILNINDFHRYFSIPSWMYRDYSFGQPDTQDEIAMVTRDFWNTDVTHMDDERELWYKAWRAIADRYKDNPYVMYALANEPIHHSYKRGGDFISDAELSHLGYTYSEVITRCIDDIRTTGSNQIIFVDRPYLLDGTGEELKYIQPVERDNIVWESHTYVSRRHTLQQWKDKIDGFEAKFSGDPLEGGFGKPLFIGEWWINPPEYRHQLTNPDWRGVTTEQVSHLDNKQLSWAIFSYGKFDGYSNWYYRDTPAYMPPEDVDYVVQTVFGNTYDKSGPMTSEGPFLGVVVAGGDMKMDHPFVTDPTFRQLTKEMGVKFVRFNGYSDPDDLLFLCKLAKEEGFEPYITLDVDYPYDPGTFQRNINIIEKTKPYCRLYEMTGEPDRPGEEWNDALGMKAGAEYFCNRWWKPTYLEMRNVHPEARLGGPGAMAYWHTTPMNSREYHDTFLRDCGPVIDKDHFFLSVHHYPNNGNRIVNEGWTREQVLDHVDVDDKFSYEDVLNELRQEYLNELGWQSEDLLISNCETYWATSVTPPEEAGIYWNREQSFVDEYAKRAYASNKAGGAWFVTMWNLAGKGTGKHNAILDPHEPDPRKPMYYALQKNWGDGEVTPTGSIYHVSPTGSNSNSGTASSPWKTITKAANTASAGDLVYVHEGVYREGGIEVAKSGTEDEPIVFMVYGYGQGNPDNVLITGAEKVSSWTRFSNNVYYKNLGYVTYQVFQNNEKLKFEPSGQNSLGAGEWWFNKNSNRLYVYVKDKGSGFNPNNYNMEVSRRKGGFILDDKEHIHVKGFKLCCFNPDIEDKTPKGVTYKVPINPAISMYRAHNNLIEGNEVYNLVAFKSIFIHGGSNNRVENNKVHDVQGAGIRIQSSGRYTDNPITSKYNVIKNNEVYRMEDYGGMEPYFGGPEVRGWMYGYGICVSHDHSQYNEVSFNTIHDNRREGIWLDVGPQNTLLYSNLVYSNEKGIFVESRPQDSEVIKNVVYDNDFGIVLGGSGTLGPSYDTKIFNNVIYGNREGVIIIKSENNEIKNNLFFDNMRGAIFVNSVNLKDTSEKETSLYDDVLDYNLYHSGSGTGQDTSDQFGWFEITRTLSTKTADKTFQEFKSASGQETHSINLHPKLVNPPSNFHLESTSPAIDAGTMISLSLMDTLAYTGDAPDIGAFEYGL
jgi:parallel beta-helix repeat protein